MVDNSASLRASARARSANARRRTLEAITQLISEQMAVTPTSVARRAGVSRQWIYTFQEALTAIREAPSPARQGAVPAAQRASAASLQRRIEILTDDNHRLRLRVAELEHRLAGAYGMLRSSRL